MQKQHRWKVAALLAALTTPGIFQPAHANTTPQVPPFSQDWSNLDLIDTDDDWSNVPGIVGYSGAGVNPTQPGNPQTALSPGAMVVDVTANQLMPGTTNLGGVFEFDGGGTGDESSAPDGDATVALQPLSTGPISPNLVITLDTTGLNSVRVQYNLRDIDTQGVPTVQPFALQFRVGTVGNFINVPAGFVMNAADNGGSQASKVTPVDATLPNPANDKPVVQVRIITTDAPGADELIGVDDISVTAQTGPPVGPGTFNINPNQVVVNEDGTSVQLTVVRSGGVTGPVSLTYSTQNGSATAGQDFTGATGGVLNFDDGQDVGTIVVPITNDSVLETVENFSVKIESASGGANIGGQATATVTIRDDEIGSGLINEIVTDPAGASASDAPFEYIELKGTPNTALANLFVVFIPGDTDNQATLGTAARVYPLSGARFGANGLLIIESSSGPAVAPQTTVVTDPDFNVGGSFGAFSTGTGTFLLLSTRNPINEGARLDADPDDFAADSQLPDGTLDGLPNDAATLDSVAFSDGDANGGPSADQPDITYSPAVLTLGSGATSEDRTPDAATRLPDSIVPNSAAAFFFGELAGTDPGGLFYDTTQLSDDAPTSPSSAPLVTPGSINFPQGTGDITGPAVTITVPTNGAQLRTLPAIQGTASDTGSGLKSVTLALYSVTRNRYFSGSGFTTPQRTELPVTVNGSGNFSLPTPTSAQGFTTGLYRVQATATDNDGNVSRSTLVSFTIDTTPPVTVITKPAADVTLLTLPTVTGTVGDFSSVQSVRVALFRYSGNTSSGPGFYFTGSGFTSRNPVYLPADLTGSNFSLQVTGTNFQDRQFTTGFYAVRTQATDTLGNTALGPVRNFRIDRRPPTVTISAPSNNSSAFSFTQITGNATDVPTSGATVSSGIQEVRIRLFRQPNSAAGTPGRFLDDTGFNSETSVTLLATLNTSTGDFSFTLPRLAAGQYSVQAFARDGQDITAASAIVNFTINVQPPPVTDLLGLQSNGRTLVRFRSNAPGTILGTLSVTGLNTNDLLISIDTRPAFMSQSVQTSQGTTTALFTYGISNNGRLYVINLSTGAATQVGNGPFRFTGSSVPFPVTGFDFNPTVDRIRITGGTSNARLNPTVDNATSIAVDANASIGGTQPDGTLAYAPGDAHDGTTPNVVGVAYTNNDTDAATGTTTFAIDRNLGTLVTLGRADDPATTTVNESVSPNSGQLFTIGDLNLPNLGSTLGVGFEIAGAQNSGFATFAFQGKATNLSLVDLLGGSINTLGSVPIGGGQPIIGLTTTPRSPFSGTSPTTTSGRNITLNLSSPGSSDASRYVVTVNGSSLPVDAAVLSNGGNSVTLTIRASRDLRRGDVIVVSFNGSTIRFTVS